MCNIRDMNIYCDINGHDMIYEKFSISIVKKWWLKH